jgi:hypothetical protein
VAAVLGMAFDYMDALPAAQVPLYGVTALEREATELRRACELFLLPAEAFGGNGKMPTLERLNGEICRLSGMESDTLDKRNNPFAELDRKYVRDLSDAAKLGDWDLVERLEAAYAAEAEEISRQRQAEIASQLDQAEINIDRRAWDKLRAKYVRTQHATVD